MQGHRQGHRQGSSQQQSGAPQPAEAAWRVRSPVHCQGGIRLFKGVNPRIHSHQREKGSYSEVSRKKIKKKSGYLSRRRPCRGTAGRAPGALCRHAHADVGLGGQCRHRSLPAAGRVRVKPGSIQSTTGVLRRQAGGGSGDGGAAVLQPHTRQQLLRRLDLDHDSQREARPEEVQKSLNPSHASRHPNDASAMPPRSRSSDRAPVARTRDSQPSPRWQWRPTLRARK